MVKRTELSAREIASYLVADALELPSESRDAFIDARAESQDVKDIALRLLKSELLATSGLLATAGGLSPRTTQLPIGTDLGPWKITGLLGQGGMGDVYSVERNDGLYEQDAALKMISETSPHLWARFTRERQVLARLEHPHIARLIDGGVSEIDSRPYLVMEKVIGRTIDDYVLHNKLSRTECLKLILPLCDALSHAHNRLTIHRDVKPSNVLVTSLGQLRLVDFGVAGLIEDGLKGERTPTTPIFAAPEQQDGTLTTVTTDTFGAGLTLYTVLTGRLPRRDKLGHIQLDLTGLGIELSTIIRKATAHNPENRYDNIDNFSDDIRAFLDKRPVSAMGGGKTYHFKRLIARNPMGTLLIGALCVAISAGLFGTTTFAVRANKALLAERDATAIAVERADFADRTSETFARLTGQAISSQDKGELDISDILKTEVLAAAEKLDQDPIGAGASLLAIAQIHERRSDSIAVLETTQHLYDSASLEPTKANMLGLAMHGIYSGFSGDVETASSALSKVKTRLNTPELRTRYFDEYVMAVAYSAEFSGDENAIDEAVSFLKEAATKEAVGDGSVKGGAIQKLNHAARLRNRLGEFDKALVLIEEAQDIANTMTNPAPRLTEPLMTARVILNMRLGRVDRAAEAADNAVSLSQSTYGPSVALGQRYESSGQLRSQIGEFESAIERFDKAAALFERFEPEPKVQFLEAKLSSAIALLNAKQTDIARDKINQLTDRVKAVCADNPIHTASLGLAMAKAKLALGEPASAQSWAKRAKESADNQARNDLSAEAQSLLDSISQ